ncbi:hypothetical protein IWX85_003889 [Polaromonas sp. CG_9.11]|nr:hypothetical protein [Polaromonas sp. CG_9.11]
MINKNGILCKLTKAHYLWTNGQAKWSIHTIKKATTKVFSCPALDNLKAYVLAFRDAFIFAKHLKALRWKTLYQSIVDGWQKNPAVFESDPRHLIL